MNIIVVGINHKTAPIEIREQFSFRTEELPEALNRLRKIEEVLECVVLTTCNRIEIYALILNDDADGLINFLLQKAPFGHPAGSRLREYIYIHKNEKALEHLCRVSSGLDSLVLGEPQIFGQVKDAFNTASESGAAGFVFRSLFPQVFALVKKIHSTTEISSKSTSVSYAAINLARTIFKGIEGRSVMILGAGEMGELTVRNLVSHGVTTVYVSNRTFEKAVRLAENYRGIPIMFYEVREYLPKVDIVISSLSAEGYVLSREDASDAQKKRGTRPLVFIDISVPRSINPNVTDLSDVYLYNIDDLKSVVESNISLRVEESQKAERLISERVRTILSQLKADDIEPAIAFLKKVSEEIRSQEFDKLSDALRLSATDRDLIQTFSKSLVGQVVHQSIVKMREYVNTMKFK